MASIPFRGPFGFCVDQYGYPANLFGREQCSRTCRHQQVTPEAATLHVMFDCQPAEPKYRDVIAPEPLAESLRQAFVKQSAGTQSVEAKDSIRRVGVESDEALCSPSCVVLASIAL